MRHFRKIFEGVIDFTEVNSVIIETSGPLPELKKFLADDQSYHYTWLRFWPHVDEHEK